MFKIMTLLVYFIMKLSIHLSGTSGPHIDTLEALALFVALLMDIPFILLIASHILAYICYPQKQNKKYYANINKTRYGQTNTRL